MGEGESVRSPGRSAGERTLPALSTKQLELRPVATGDLSLMIALNSDPRVMRFILGRAATPEETLLEWHQRLTRQTDPTRGLGYWAGFADGEFVGWWSASAFEEWPCRSGVGHRLCATAWGRGLATEGARAMVVQAFCDPAVERVYASTMAINIASRHVLEKVGMVHTSSWTQEWQGPIPGSEAGEVGYELTRAEWARGSNS